jgi:hypothetical protein
MIDAVSEIKKWMNLVGELDHIFDLAGHYYAICRGDTDNIDLFCFDRAGRYKWRYVNNFGSPVYYVDEGERFIRVGFQSGKEVLVSFDGAFIKTSRVC